MISSPRFFDKIILSKASITLALFLGTLIFLVFLGLLPRPSVYVAKVFYPRYIHVSQDALTNSKFYKIKSLRPSSDSEVSEIFSSLTRCGFSDTNLSVSSRIHSRYTSYTFSSAINNINADIISCSLSDLTTTYNSLYDFLVENRQELPPQFRNLEISSGRLLSISSQSSFLSFSALLKSFLLTISTLSATYILVLSFKRF